MNHQHLKIKSTPEDQSVAEFIEKWRTVLIVLLISASLAGAVTLTLKRQRVATGPGDIRYIDRSEWASFRSVAPDGDEWNPRSGKYRWGFDCPVLADGYEIKMHGPAFTDVSLANANLTALYPVRTLHLDSSRVTDAGLKNLEALSELKKLDLSGTLVTDEGVWEFRKARPKCYVFRGPITRSLSNLRSKPALGERKTRGWSR